MFRGWLFRGSRGVLLVVALLAVGTGTALASRTVTVNRCGFAAKGFFGRNAIYPWRMSCGMARTVLAGAINPHARTITLTADGASTGDAQPVRINGRWWVCGGRMGSYFCGYPYRPARVSGPGGGTTWRGPFTRTAAFYACSVAAGICGRRGTVFLPSG